MSDVGVVFCTKEKKKKKNILNPIPKQNKEIKKVSFQEKTVA